jgi:hypothetical protein
MTDQIWKYELKTPAITLEIPKGAKTLSVESFNGVPMLRVLCSPSKPLVSRTFVICGAGLPVTEGRNIYVGTFNLLAGALVFYVFEK